MKILLKQTPAGEHEWFAWFPVVARKKVPTGYVPVFVWLQKVRRTRVSAMGLSQWLYEIT